MLPDEQVYIAVAVAIGQASEPDAGQLQGGIKAAAPVVPHFDGPTFDYGQIQESIAVEVASPQVNVWSVVKGYG